MHNNSADPNQPVSRQNPFNTDLQPDFYYNLKHYQPICNRSSHQKQSFSNLNSDDQRPSQTYLTFLLNKGWWKSLVCILLINALFLLIYLKFVLDTRVKYVDSGDSSEKPIATYTKSQNYNTMAILCIISLLLIDMSYFLTQFLNPGIRNLAEIPQQQLNQAKKVDFCEKCSYYKTQKFTHCSECEVCIWNYDHHCGFFSKCVGGRAQFWAFLMFLASVTAGFLILLGCVTVQLGGTV